MTRSERPDEATRTEADESHTEVIASTLAALQARVDEADRQALRGAVSFHPPLAPGRPPADPASR